MINVISDDHRRQPIQHAPSILSSLYQYRRHGTFSLTEVPLTLVITKQSPGSAVPASRFDPNDRLHLAIPINAFPRSIPCVFNQTASKPFLVPSPLEHQGTFRTPRLMRSPLRTPYDHSIPYPIAANNKSSSSYEYIEGPRSSSRRRKKGTVKRSEVRSSYVKRVNWMIVFRGEINE